MSGEHSLKRMFGEIPAAGTQILSPQGFARTANLRFHGIQIHSPNLRILWAMHTEFVRSKLLANILSSRSTADVLPCPPISTGRDRLRKRYNGINASSRGQSNERKSRIDDHRRSFGGHPPVKVRWRWLLVNDRAAVSRLDVDACFLLSFGSSCHWYKATEIKSPKSTEIVSI